MKKFLVLLAVALAFFAFTSCGDTEDDNGVVVDAAAVYTLTLTEDEVNLSAWGNPDALNGKFLVVRKSEASTYVAATPLVAYAFPGGAANAESVVADLDADGSNPTANAESHGGGAHFESGATIPFITVSKDGGAYTVTVDGADLAAYAAWGEPLNGADWDLPAAIAAGDVILMSVGEYTPTTVDRVWEGGFDWYANGTPFAIDGEVPERPGAVRVSLDKGTYIAIEDDETVTVTVVDEVSEEITDETTEVTYTLNFGGDDIERTATKDGDAFVDSFTVGNENDDDSAADYKFAENVTITVTYGDVSNTAAVVVELFDVVFKLDPGEATLTGPVYVTGFAGWSEPGSDGDDVELVLEDGVWTGSGKASGAIEYKYFDGAGWDGGEDIDGNREANITADTTLEDVWGVKE